MASKLTLLIQGLLVMVIVLISSMGQARHLDDFSTKRNHADSIKYCAKISGKANDDTSSDCFMIPGVPGLPIWPNIPGFPRWPGIGNQPVTPATPLIPSPVITPATPLIQNPPKVEVATKQNGVDGVKYCAKTSDKANGDASIDCFMIPGIPSLPWPSIPGFPQWSGIGNQPLTPTTPLIPSPPPPVTSTTLLIPSPPPPPPVTSTTLLIPSPPTTPATPSSPTPPSPLI